MSHEYIVAIALAILKMYSSIINDVFVLVLNNIIDVVDELGNCYANGGG